MPRSGVYRKRLAKLQGGGRTKLMNKPMAADGTHKRKAIKPRGVKSTLKSRRFLT